MKKTWKRILSLGLAAALSLPAWILPASAAAVGTNLERLIETASEKDEVRKQITDISSSELPKKFTYRSVSEDKKVTVTAGAEIFPGRVEAVPIYRASCQGFTQEQVSAIFRYFFDGEDAWYAQDNQYYTKAMADADLAEARQELARLEADTTLSEEDREFEIAVCQDDIDGLNAIYDTLPEEVVKLPTDGTMLTETATTLDGDREYQRLDARTDGGKKLSVMNFMDWDAGSCLEYCSETGKRFRRQPDAGRNKGVYPVFVLDGDQHKILETLGEKMASFFTATGLPAMRLIQLDTVFAAKEVKTGYGQTTTTYDDQDSALRLCYARNIAGLPAAVTPSSVLYLEDDSPTWLYERLYITLDQTGISNIYWSYPVTTGEQVLEDVDILPYKEAARIFKETAVTVFKSEVAALEKESGTPCRLTVNVTTVRLSMIRLRDGDKLSGLYVPAWVFYGTKNLYSDDTATFSPSPWIVYAINAIDGGIIDIKAGC